MKNITVSVNDDLYHRARVKAAENRTTLSAMVRSFLERMVEDPVRFEDLLREQDAIVKAIREEHTGYSAEERLTRDEVHDRNALR